MLRQELLLLLLLLLAGSKLLEPARSCPKGAHLYRRKVREGEKTIKSGALMVVLVLVVVVDKRAE